MDRHQRRSVRLERADHHPRRARRGRRAPPPTPTSGPAHRPSDAACPSATSPPGSGHRFTAPGARARELPIPGDPGVYWIGVHALGTNRSGSRPGRRRTRAHVHPARADATGPPGRTVPMSVVPPVREARRDADGSLNGPTRWVHLHGPEGRLDRLADFGASAGRRRSPGWSTRRCSTLRRLRPATRRSSLRHPLVQPERHRQRRGERPDRHSPSPSPSPRPTPAHRATTAAARANARAGHG